jgi:hypothetical protein
MTTLPFSRNTNPELPDVYAASEYEHRFPVIQDEDPIMRNGFATCCLPGGYTRCHTLLENTRAMCPKYMEQYCSKNFDDNCKLYLAGMTTTDDQKLFLNNVLKNKYCKLSANSNCTKVCESVDPLNPQLDKVCSDVGQDLGFDPSRSVDVGLGLPVNVSPVYRLESGCNKECDMETMKTDPIYAILNGITNGTKVSVEVPSDGSSSSSYMWTVYLGISIFVIGVAVYLLLRKRKD